MSDGDQVDGLRRPLRKAGGQLDFSAMSVLVLDDNAFFGRLLQQIFRGFGTESVSVTGSPEDALMLLATGRYHLIIADQMIGTHVGSDFVSRIRAADGEPYQEVPIIMVSAHTDTDNVRRMRDCGATEILAKPISPGSLLERIELAFKAPRPFVKGEEYRGPDRRRRAAAYDGQERRGDGTAPPKTSEDPS